jgi:hypothetical protein
MGWQDHRYNTALKQQREKRSERTGSCVMLDHSHHIEYLTAEFSCVSSKQLKAMQSAAVLGISEASKLFDVSRNAIAEDAALRSS